MDQDPYRVLGLDKNADPAEVKRAFRALAMRYHPDVSTEADAAKRFEEVRIAADAILNRVRHA
jgi:DnaJ-class molecular chaperone